MTHKNANDNDNSKSSVKAVTGLSRNMVAKEAYSNYRYDATKHQNDFIDLEYCDILSDTFYFFYMKIKLAITNDNIRSN